MHLGTYTDPRPDIAHDHHLWRRILICCQGQPNIQAKLHYVRCLGGWLTETPTMYRLLQGDIADHDWAEIKEKILDRVYPQLVKMFPRWRQESIPENVLACAIYLDTTLADAAETLEDHPFKQSVQVGLWEEAE